MNNFINIYTDGSCFNNGKSNSTGSIGVFFKDNDERNISESINNMKITNQRMELLAVIKSIEKLKENEKAYIYTDSKYVINSMTKWVRNWELNDWKKSDNKKVENKDLIMDLRDKLKSKFVIFKHIKSHQNEPSNNDINYIHWYGNKMADYLALQSNKNNLKNILNKQLDETFDIIKDKNSLKKMKNYKLKKEFNI
jgi:ribonuclease HI